jgi:hypothetical protein
MESFQFAKGHERQEKRVASCVVKDVIEESDETAWESRRGSERAQQFRETTESGETLLRYPWIKVRVFFIL